MSPSAPSPSAVCHHPPISILSCSSAIFIMFSACRMLGIKLLSLTSAVITSYPPQRPVDRLRMFSRLRVGLVGLTEHRIAVCASRDCRMPSSPGSPDQCGACLPMANRMSTSLIWIFFQSEASPAACLHHPRGPYVETTHLYSFTRALRVGHHLVEHLHTCSSSGVYCEGSILPPCQSFIKYTV